MSSLYELTSEYKELLEMLEDADLDADVIKDTCFERQDTTQKRRRHGYDKRTDYRRKKSSRKKKINRREH